MNAYKNGINWSIQHLFIYWFEDASNFLALTNPYSLIEESEEKTDVDLFNLGVDDSAFYLEMNGYKLEANLLREHNSAGINPEFLGEFSADDILGKEIDLEKMRKLFYE